MMIGKVMFLYMLFCNRATHLARDRRVLVFGPTEKGELLPRKKSMNLDTSYF